VPIPRPRVVERLQAAGRQPIVLIAAPAGYGKSVALRQYLATLTQPSLRFDLGPSHMELLGFLHGFAEAVASHAPHAATTLAGAYARSRASASPVVDLALWMHAHLRDFDGVIAIDDLHAGDGDVAIAAFVVALIERTKDSIGWVLASRSTTGLPVGTWLAYGDTDLAIDERDLRFSIDEAAETAEAFRVSIGRGELEELLDLTDGWPTALSFALRTSTRSSDLRSIAAGTRDIMYRYFAEQVYADFDDEERELMAVATALPSVDVAVLEKAGFDRALAIVEGLRERTAFIFAESPRVFRCHDLFREFIRRTIERDGHKRFASIHERAARALEGTGNLERALDAYAIAGARIDVQRVLELHGFDLLERASGDVVARAVEALDESVRRDNAHILALRGMLQATAGKNARAEALFSRAIANAGEDRELVAIASLRLAILLWNQGRDTSGLLDPLIADLGQSHSRRAEALSLLTAQRSLSGDLAGVRGGIEQIESLLINVDSEPTRGKVLQRMGVALHRAGETDRAKAAFLEAADIGNERHLYSLVSRACAGLSNLVAIEENDFTKQLHYAERATEGATRAGDVFDLQTSLLQVLTAELRLGNAERCQELEEQLMRVGTSDSALAVYVVASRALRAAWDGRFEEAYSSLATCYERLYHDVDRVIATAVCAMLLALLGQRDASFKLTQELIKELDAAEPRGVFRIRLMAQARMLCALSEAICGRTTHAVRHGRSIARHTDAFVILCARTVEMFASARRRGGTDAADELEKAATSFRSFGCGDVARLLEATSNALAREAGSAIEGITPTELDILRQLADGASPKDIASRTNRSVHTIRAHVANITAKLGCHGRLEAVALARRKGWLD
jgi:ATP/maltotriose-dependent transcriptional regulator MalT